MTPDPIEQCLNAYDAGTRPERATEKAAVKALLAKLVEIAPGNSVEVRIPPYSAVQAIPGVKHRRGNPPAQVETDGRTWVLLATGRLSWADALQSGELSASGERSDLSRLLPLVTYAG